MVDFLKRTVPLLLFFLSGCVSINIPTVQPLVEQTIGGRGKDKIVIIDISGVIKDEQRDSLMGLYKEPPLTSRIKEELDKAGRDEAVKAVVLRINSPGGVVTTCDIIHHEIERFKERTGKIVVAELMDIATSGAYYIAVSADSIVAHPTTITGSIGVVAFKINASGLLEKIGVVNETIKSGEKKDLVSPLRGMTDEERSILQGIIDGMFSRFVDVVKAGREDINTGDLDDIFDGRVFLAHDALRLKLIDSIGYLDDAIGLAKKKAGIKEAKIVVYSRPGTYRANVYSSHGTAFPHRINLINIESGGLLERFGLNFMYMWMP